MEQLGGIWSSRGILVEIAERKLRVTARRAVFTGQSHTVSGPAVDITTEELDAVNRGTGCMSQRTLSLIPRRVLTGGVSANHVVP